jgi:hypothetical protein
VIRARAAALVAVALAMCAGVAGAEPATSEGTVEQPKDKMVAQAAPKTTPRKAEPTEATSLADRVTALEKQGVVLSEDVGKTRLDQRMQLDALAKRQAEAIAKLNQQMAEQQAQAERERQKQATRNKYLWIAIGVLAVGVIAK